MILRAKWLWTAHGQDLTPKDNKLGVPTTFVDLEKMVQSKALERAEITASNEEYLKYIAGTEVTIEKRRWLQYRDPAATESDINKDSGRESSAFFEKLKSDK
ncbi:Oidioi.mRNA.OKI2018_I69.YSR.g17176.t1.cds [Oikopleura dioica]|uniref:Oidioi.mRNA.OKI2018_I69.YSR.g17176.t1.cds n=1 Tax=Oikopleura dioica TaxID=34765 RepID=A0ABN7SNK1_OIKDI|nr:Oidioi.mRNA.OKI2018_I69.YSR.g17176.t1.cds [Oikopleura dioica]